ncbi:phosphoenolpyruvate--protein phosphotransferase [Candidatus Fermentibacteria bacterium]|nr:phosphoenolpyruvate--protein phosphotransferase [Candidatus Fermentibacteria bacterium]
MENHQSVIVQGLPVAEGVALGRAFVYSTDVSCVLRREVPDQEVDHEISRFVEAREDVERYYEAAVEEAVRDLGQEEADILRSHFHIVRDPYFMEEVPELIRSQNVNPEWLVSEGVHRIAKTLGDSPDSYLRERATDVEDVGRQLLHRLLQMEGIGHIPGHEPVVVVARELTPSDILRLKKSRVLALVTELGTATSHAAVIAKPLNIPVVMGITGLMNSVRTDDTIFVDGSKGEIHLNPDPAAARLFQRRIREAQDHRVRIVEDTTLPALTTDGVKVSLLANLAHPEETHAALAAGAEGVGLFRTEFAFLAEGRLLDEDEQYAIYEAVVRGMAGRPVVIRTLDLGGDKLVPHHERQLEANPFLGWRSIRISLQMKESFKIQLRSILRASASGPTSIMYPMISTVDEVIDVKAVVDEVMRDLMREGLDYNPQIPQGMMIEVPSAAVNIRAFLPHTDFVSIGTNDLVQYALAVDRNNPRVASYYRPCDPAVLRLIRHTAWTTRRARKHTSVCGEMAGRPRYAPLLIGLGVDELSMAPNLIPAVKHIIRNTSLADAAVLARDTLACSTATEVEKLVDTFVANIPGS